MQPEFLERLSLDLQDLVLTTEQAIGFSIEVLIGPTRACDGFGGLQPLACEVGKDFARVLVPAVEQLLSGSVFHELQHIRRFLVEGAPMLVDNGDYVGLTPEMATALTAHDNAFEHLLIVPRELLAYPERRKHWESVMKRCWDGIASGQPDSLSRRQLGLATWVFLRQVMPDCSMFDVARCALIESNFLERAEKFCSALLPVLQNKKAAMQVWFEHQQVPIDIASLRYFRPLDCFTWEEPLARQQ